MPRISSLPRDGSLSGNETLVGTDTDTGESRKFILSDVKDYVNNALTIDTNRIMRSGQVTMSNGTDEQTFTVSGITASSIVTATISFNDNGRYIKRVQPGTNSLTVKLQGAADTAIISYIAIG